MSDEDVVYTMDIDLEGSPKGELIQIAGLGTFENGNSYEITRGEADAFRSYNTSYVPIIGEDEEILGSEPELGPTLLQASKTMMDGISVQTSGSKSKADEEAEAKAQADAEAARQAELDAQNDDEDDGGDN